MTRPGTKKPKSKDGRPIFLRVRLSEAESAVLETVAAHKGASLSQVVRERLFEPVAA